MVQIEIQNHFYRRTENVRKQLVKSPDVDLHSRFKQVKVVGFVNFIVLQYFALVNHCSVTQNSILAIEENRNKKVIQLQINLHTWRSFHHLFCTVDCS